jgi:hypothetical protein
MLKKLFFLAALMTAPCLALAADPSANLSVQVVPAGSANSVQCPVTAPAGAAQAGFTTMAFCNDFTQPIPNIAGTGLPADWFGRPNPPGQGGQADCNHHVWYGGEKDYYYGGSVSTAIVTDPTYGNLAVDLPYTATDQQLAGGHSFMNSASACATALSQTNLYLDFPMGMFVRIVSRNNINSVICADTGNVCNPNSIPHANADFFTWSAACWMNLCGSGNVVEVDAMENISNTVFGGSLHQWPIGGSGPVNYGTGGIFGGTSLPSGFDDSQYHTYEMLMTTDGAKNMEVCNWVDGTFYKCDSSNTSNLKAPGTTVDNSGSVIQRNVLATWSANLNWQAQNGCPDRTGAYQSWCIKTPIHHYIKSIQVWSCQDWQRGSPGPNPNCAGPARVTGADGSQFYKVATQ